MSSLLLIVAQRYCMLLDAVTNILADRRAYGTMRRPSVCHLSSVTKCTVAKQYFIGRRRWYRWIGRSVSIGCQ